MGELCQGDRVLGTQGALEPKGGRFCHFHHFRVASPPVAEDMSQLNLGQISFDRFRVALRCRIQQGPPLRLSLFPGGQAMIGVCDRLT